MAMKYAARLKNCTNFCLMSDKIVESVIDQFRTRAEAGKRKYGTTMERDDLTFIEWIQHLQEELMDAVVYIEKIKNEAR
jgi:hypothetical protein